MAALRFPPEVRDNILYELYASADALNWELLSQREKTDQYRRWVDDPAVGEVMLRYGAEKDVRVWLKDNAMKEYARAQEGIGSFVRYLPRRFRGANEIVSAALGDLWVTDPDSIEIKPNRCTAIRGSSARTVLWGRHTSFKDLFWAALTAAHDQRAEPVIVITARAGENISDDLKRWQQSVGARAEFDVIYLNRDKMSNPDYIPPRSA